MTIERIRQELDDSLGLPGLTNAWVYPIQTRIDMLQTGIQTDVGVMVTGSDLAVIQELTTRLAVVVEALPGTVSAFAEQPAGGRYITIEINRVELGRFDLDIAAVHDLVRYGIGGAAVSETV